METLGEDHGSEVAALGMVDLLLGSVESYAQTGVLRFALVNSKTTTAISVPRCRVVVREPRGRVSIASDAGARWVREQNEG